MPVYVDNARLPFGRMIICYMVADILEELHEMADRIGLKQLWFQNQASHPHYDISRSKRALAVKHGAIEVDRHGIIDVMRRNRAKKVLSC